MKLKSITLLSTAAFCSLLMTSCGGKKEEVKDEQITKDTLKGQVIADVSMIRTNIPSPSSISKNFNKAGYAYMKNLLNPSGKGGSYASKYQAAFGMGAYGADLGYIGAYNQNGDAGEYLTQISKLAQQLKIESAFDPAFLQKMGSAKGDSINDMLDQAFAKAERNLRSNDRMATAAIVIAGGWIEGLHIAVEAIGSKPKDDKNKDLYHEIYVHVYAFQNVQDLLNQYVKDADCKKVLDELTPFNGVFTDYANAPNIGDKDLGRLKDALNTIRTKLL
ncbi:MAG TPA: hypothetical protein VNZ86_16670 [Bacteroidia bacterium]|jgi:hypothetical protein|nr:hypothetical protein [Bacteroidia bacterium]